MALFNSPQQRKPLFMLALIAVPFVFVVIALGAFTRLADAGLGCPDWPTCYGHVLWPDEHHEIAAANEAFNETPVETDKTWPEQVHRLFASALGLISLVVFFLSIRINEDKSLNKALIALVGVFMAALITRIYMMATKMEVTAAAMHDNYDIIIGVVTLIAFAVLAAISIKKGPSQQQPIKLPTLIVGFVILQGLFGMWTVTLKVWPQVVTTHLLGGFTMAALFWLLALRLNNQTWQLNAGGFQQIRRQIPWFWLGFAIVVVQIALGGWTTSNYAAVACPDLPTCQGKLWPDMDVAAGFNIAQGIGPNYLGGIMDNEARIAIHMAHRIGAIITTIYLMFMIGLLLRNDDQQTRPLAYTITAVLFLQLLLGLSNIIFHFPLAVAVAHNAGGAVLLLTMVTLMHRAVTVQQVASNNKG